MTRDWQDEAAYRHFDSLDLSGLAWECLRRNSDYRATYPLMRDGLRSPAVNRHSNLTPYRHPIMTPLMLSRPGAA